jgi:outer membrane biosynthesis protein TonB
LSLLIFVSPLFAQTPSDLGIVKMPKPKLPAEAKETGLGGRVTVIVEVDQAGNVTAVKEASGPDWVCPFVTRPDVLALRDAARAAALKVKFSPEVVVAGDSSIEVFFDFPKTEIEEKKAKGQNYSASPPDQAPPQTAGNPSKDIVKGDPAPAVEKAPAADYVGPVTPPEGKKYGTWGDPGKKDENRYTIVGEAVGKLAAGSISGGILNGKAKLLPKPQYPRAAKAVRASGAVSIQVLIDEEGKVFSAVPVAGHPLLRSAARLAACQAEFSPTRLSGNLVKVNGVIVYNFVF